MQVVMQLLFHLSRADDKRLGVRLGLLHGMRHLAIGSCQPLVDGSIAGHGISQILPLFGSGDSRRHSLEGPQVANEVSMWGGALR